MNKENTTNNFSIVSRLFGNLFYRQPTDEILTPIFNWLQKHGLSQFWALETDIQSQQALEQLQMTLNPNALLAEYNKLFAPNGRVSTKISDYGINVDEFATFRIERGMPLIENADHVGLLLLTASWLEDHCDSSTAQRILFEKFLLSCANKFLPQVENQAVLPFYRALALLTREILAAMADELEESEV